MNPTTSDESIFSEAAELSDARRETYLDKACGSDTERRNRIEALLNEHDNPDSVFDRTELHVKSFGESAQIVPQTLGDFEIIGELGRGGMGVVYEARQKSLKRKVALKVLSSGLGLSSKAILRFRREAEAAGKLHHTNIVPIYTTGEDRGIHFYAMELIDGPSLDAVIKDLKQETPEGTEESEPEADVPSWLRKTSLYDATGPAPARIDASSVSSSSMVAHGSGYFDHVATMIAEVADALEHAHEHGVIHRDIKPSNLLLAPDGRLSVNDFGLARMLEQPGMTMTGEFVGSPLYMSPEQITAGRAPLDHRTDIYSLGATLYELLTLQPPFPGDSRDQVIGQILHKEASSPRKLHRRVPVDLETICMKAIERDPDRRYQTAGQMADDLRKYVNRYAISARRIGPLGKGMRWARRNPVPALATAAIFLACCVTLGVIRHNALIRKKADLDRISSAIFESLLRADFSKADKLLVEGSQLHPSSDWLHFSEGQINLFKSEYGSAKERLRLVRKGPNRVAAQGLLAVAHMWSGDEGSYFRQLRRIEDISPSDFKEFLCVGYAHCWGEPKLAIELLDEAALLEKNHSFVRVVRSQALRLRAMDLVDAERAKSLIDRALIDIESQKHMVNDVPLVATETTLCHLVASNIYKKLGKKAEAELHEAAARQMERILMKLEKSPKVPYVLVLLLSHFGPREVLALDERWRSREFEIEPHACNWMGINLLQCREYDKALEWLDRRGNSATGKMWKFLDRYVLLASSSGSESLQYLRRQAEDDLIQHAEDKLVQFDVSQIELLGGDGATRRFIREDTKHEIISDFDLIFDYFGDPPDSREMSASELLERCDASDRPVFHRMHGNFFLGIEALAIGEEELAESYFEACRNDNGFQFCVYRLSQALLEHRKEWGDWIDR